MTIIKLLRDVRPSNFTRTDEDARRLDNPIGRASLKDGPLTETCGACVHLDIRNSVWSDHGTAAPCLEHKRLRDGKTAQVIPACWRACDRFRRRPGVVDGILSAARFDTRIMAAHRNIDRLNIELNRACDALAELERQRQEINVVVDGAKSAAANDLERTTTR